VGLGPPFFERTKKQRWAKAHPTSIQFENAGGVEHNQRDDHRQQEHAHAPDQRLAPRFGADVAARLGEFVGESRRRLDAGVAQQRARA